MQNYKIEITTSKAFNVKAHTAQEAIDFIMHTYFNTNIIDTNTESTECVHFSCRSVNKNDTAEYMAIRENGGFDIVDTSKPPYKSVI